MPCTAGPRRSTATVRDDGAHVDLPARAVGVAAHQADGLLADLDGDVHVVQRHALRHELGARKIVTLDDDSHRVPFWRRSTHVAGSPRANVEPEPAVARNLHRQENPSPGDVIELDLSHVAFIDSSGVAMLQKARTRFDALECQLVLTNPSTSVRSVLTILGLLEYFSVDNEVSAAAADC